MGTLLKIILPAILLVLGFSCKQHDRRSQNRDMAAQPASHFEAQDPLQQSIRQGLALYEDFCLQCHGSDGKGILGIYPPLAQSNWLLEKRTESVHTVKYGQKGNIQVNGESYNGIMPPMGLTDEEVANVLNYIMNSWGNNIQPMITPEEVSKIQP